jgi:LmbE family N-acetylglucosaminyl deacetylase
MLHKLLIIGAHPDDPETAAGGLMARYAAAGHEVVALYVTRGEAGIAGCSHAEAAAIRSAECEQACTILRVRPRFLGQLDGACEVTAHWYGEMRRIFDEEKPDAVFTHWPIDTHRDHRVTASLVYDAWWGSGRASALFYFETLTGIQTQHFSPTDYIDISAVEPVKEAACRAHVSQGFDMPGAGYLTETRISTFRGLAIGCAHAEAFVRHEQGAAFSLLRT